jgi:Methyltransferase domain
MRNIPEGFQIFLVLVILCWNNLYNLQTIDLTTDEFVRQSVLRSRNAQNEFEKGLFAEIEVQARRGLEESTKDYPDRVRKNLLRAQASGNSYYFNLAERDMAAQWDKFISPFLPLDADYSYVLEIAPGHGRNTVRLLDVSERIVGVEINQDNVDFLKNRFSKFPQLSFYKTDGLTLPRELDNHVSFVYSFDAMVQFDKEVVASYLKEMSRVMRVGALGYLHHSQTPECPLTFSNGFCSKPDLLGDDPENPHQRNANSKENVARDAEKYGLTVVNQYDVIWDEKFGATDAVTIVKKNMI